MEQVHVPLFEANLFPNPLTSLGASLSFLFMVTSTDLTTSAFLAFSNACWNSVEISGVLKRAANFSSLPSPSAKSMAAQIHEFLDVFISVSFMSAVM